MMCDRVCSYAYAYRRMKSLTFTVTGVIQKFDRETPRESVGIFIFFSFFFLDQSME